MAFSMNASEEKNRPLRSQPFEGLESPFLDQELYAESGEEQLEARLGALEAESPFWHTFDQGRPILIGPTEPDEEFVEEEEWADADDFAVEEAEAYEDAPEKFGEAESWQEPEEPEFEYDLSSSPRDFSLKDIADKDNLPGEIRTDILRDGKTDVKDLANRALWFRHADIVGQQLDRTGSKHAKFRAEWAVYAQQAKALIWLRQVIDELDKTRGDIPRDFLLGWMAVESDGKVNVVTRRPERGYFQIDWKAGEAQEQLGLSKTQFKELSTNRTFSIKKGIELVEKYRQWILNNYTSVPDRCV